MLTSPGFFFEEANLFNYKVVKMRVHQKRYPRIKLFGKLSYSDVLDRDFLHKYTKYRNVTKCRYLFNLM